MDIKEELRKAFSAGKYHEANKNTSKVVAYDFEEWYNKSNTLKELNLLQLKENDIIAKIEKIKRQRRELLDDYLEMDEEMRGAMSLVIVEKELRIKDLQSLILLNK